MTLGRPRMLIAIESPSALTDRAIRCGNYRTHSSPECALVKRRAVTGAGLANDGSLPDDLKRTRLPATM